MGGGIDIFVCRWPVVGSVALLWALQSMHTDSAASAHPSLFLVPLACPLRDVACCVVAAAGHLTDTLPGEITSCFCPLDARRQMLFLQHGTDFARDCCCSGLVAVRCHASVSSHPRLLSMPCLVQDELVCPSPYAEPAEPGCDAERRMQLQSDCVNVAHHQV